MARNWYRRGPTDDPAIVALVTTAEAIKRRGRALGRTNAITSEQAGAVSALLAGIEHRLTTFGADAAPAAQVALDAILAALEAPGDLDHVLGAQRYWMA